MPKGIASKTKLASRPKFNSKSVWLTEDGTILKAEHVRMIGSPPDGAISFHSGLEAQYYRDVLKPLDEEGTISVELQPRFEILRGFENDGAKYLPVYYLPDFAVTYPDGRLEVIDVKGFTTDIFMLKRKMFLSAHPGIRLLVLKHVRKFGGWISIEDYKTKKRQERRGIL